MPTVKMVFWQKTLQVKPVLRHVYIKTQSHARHIEMPYLFEGKFLKYHVSLQDTISQVMF